MGWFGNSKLGKARRALARELAEAGLWAHLSPDTRDAGQRAVAAGG